MNDTELVREIKKIEHKNRVMDGESLSKYATPSFLQQLKKTFYSFFLSVNKITVIVPAHNEEDGIESTIRTLYQQTLKPHKIIVMADNCTDKTVFIACQLQLEFPDLIVNETINNKHRKAGAINQAFRYVDTEFVFVMDADTKLDKYFLEHAVNRMGKDKSLGGLCSRMLLKDPPKGFISKLLWSLQHIEYGAGDSVRLSSQNKTKILAGMATVYRTQAWKEVLDLRKELGQMETIYKEGNITEDYELTVRIRQLGYSTSVDMSLLAWTKVPTTIKGFWMQRLRWAKGHIDTLRETGLRKFVLPDLFDVVITLFFSFVQIYFIIFLIWMTMNGHGINLDLTFLLMVTIYLFDVFYRFRYVENKRFLDWVVVLSIIPYNVFAYFNVYILIHATFKSFFTKTELAWKK